MAPEMLLVAETSTITLLTCTVPIEKFWTSECVVTVRLPPKSTTVWLVPEAPLKGCARSLATRAAIPAIPT